MESPEINLDEQEEINIGKELPKRKIFRKVLKIAGWVLFALLVLVLSLTILIQIPSVQNRSKNYITNYLQTKTGAAITIDRLSLRFPGWLVLENIFVPGEYKDTILFGKSIAVDIDLLALLKNEVIINEIWLQDTKANLIKNTQNKYNFDFIINSFSGPAAVADTSSSPGMVIKPDKIKLDRVVFNYTDSVGGLSTLFEVDHLNANIQKLDLDKMQFHFGYLDWDGGVAKIDMYDGVSIASEKPEASGATSLLPVFTIHDPTLSDVYFSYNSPPSGMNMQALSGIIQSDSLLIDLNKSFIGLGNIQLKNTAYAIQMFKAPPSAGSGSDSAVVWHVQSGQISLKNGDVKYDDLDAGKLKGPGMDYGHMRFKKVNLKGENLYVAGGDTVQAQINEGSLVENAGFKITGLKSFLTYTPFGITLENADIKTPYSHISDYLSVGYASVQEAAENPGNVYVKANLKKAVINHRDLLNVAPILYNYNMFTDYPKADLKASGKISGQINNLYLDNINVEAFAGTKVSGTGYIKGLPDIDKLETNLSVKELTLTSADLKTFIPPELIPENIQLPEWVKVTGTMKGSFQQKLTTDLKLTSNLGGASLKGILINGSDEILATYDLVARFIDFDLGTFLGQSDMVGKTSGQIAAKGRGYNPKSMIGEYAASIEKIDIQQYSYQNLYFKGQADNGKINLEASSNEKAYEFNGSMYADLQNEFPGLLTDFTISNLDLQALGFVDSTLSLGMRLHGDISKLDIKQPVGSFIITQLTGLSGSNSFSFDSMSVSANSVAGLQTLRFNSRFGLADITGHYTLDGIFPEIVQFANRYYRFGEPSPALLGTQDAQINITLLPAKEIFQLMPDLHFIDPLTMQLDFDSKLCVFDLQGTIPDIQYGLNKLQRGEFNIEANDSSLAYKFYFDEVSNDIFDIPTALIQGEIMHNTVYLGTRLLDSKGRTQYTLAAKLEHDDSLYYLHFDPESVMLEYEDWGLDRDNQIIFTEKGDFAIHSFTFSNGSQAIIMQTLGDTLNAPLYLRLFNFEISTFSSVARQDSLYLNGLVNGSAELELNKEFYKFYSDLEVENLTIKNDSVGNLSIHAYNESESNIKLEILLTGNENKATVSGTYNTDAESFDMLVDVEQFKFSNLEPFTFGYLNQLKGHLEGGISITGTLDEPLVIGNLLFRQAKANSPILNSVFSLENERIRFLEDGIHFNQFTFTDEEGKEAILNGVIETRDWLQYKFNLGFEAKNFRVINNTQKDYHLLYGTMYMDSKIDLKGDIERPVVNATFKVNENTNMTMVMPQDEPGIAEREGIVEFIDPKNPYGTNELTLALDSLSKTSIKGLDLNANIEIDRNAVLNFIIDENNGDYISTKGTASLNGGIDPSGRITMVGTYELDEGFYETNMLMVTRRKFNIQKGSSIIWTGEPTTADIDITALYNVKASPYDLVESMISGESEEDQVKYKDRIPIEVKLLMKGELLTPDLGFDIDIKESSGLNTNVVRTIESKFDQMRIEPSEMNKQVLSLILLSRFVPEQPFSSGSSGVNVSLLARQSMSQLLSDQLNNLASNLITGVDVDFGINSEEDFVNGGQTRTDLNIAVSKRLLNDRLKISIGSNFELEGAARVNQKTTNIAGDIELDYKLSKSGQYLLRAYRKDQYEVALQGQVIETGVGFIISIDFDTFNEIIKRKKSKN